MRKSVSPILVEIFAGLGLTGLEEGCIEDGGDLDLEVFLFGMQVFNEVVRQHGANSFFEYDIAKLEQIIRFKLKPRATAFSLELIEVLKIRQKELSPDLLAELQKRKII